MDSSSEVISSVTSSSEEVISSLNLKDPSTWNIEDIWMNFVGWCKQDGIRYLLAFIILVFFFFVNKLIARAIRKSLRKNPKSEGVANAVYRAVKAVLNVVAIIIFLGYIGIDMAGVSSIIASCAVALGLALQGSLSNIAGWIIIIVTKPFRLGDFITAQGESGTVEEINLFFTHLKTPDNKTIFLPNGTLSNGTIVNVSCKDKRRLDEVFTISYNDDPQTAINAIKKVISHNKLILKNPEPFVRVSKYADSAIEVTSRVWVKSGDYWTVHWDLLQDVKKAFDEAGITIPFNQYDVNLVTVNGEATLPKKKVKTTSKKK